MVKVREDMTGWKMWEHGILDSRIIVIRQVEDYINPASGQHIAMWEYKCTCEKGTISRASGTNLKRGSVKSCGCVAIEKNTKRLDENRDEYAKKRRKSNEYDLSGEYGIGWTSNTHKEFYFDLEDYDKIKDYCWSECVDRKGYHSLKARERGSGTRLVRMHHLIKGKNYDHQDRNPFNNRKNNLRLSTQRENRQNNSISSKNTSGVTGVHYDKKANRWIASVSVDYQRINVYYGSSKEEAIKARLEAEAKYYGKFAPQQHLFEQYGITIQNDSTEIEPIENLEDNEI